MWCIFKTPKEDEANMGMIEIMVKKALFKQILEKFYNEYWNNE